MQFYQLFSIFKNLIMKEAPCTRDFVFYSEKAENYAEADIFWSKEYNKILAELTSSIHAEDNPSISLAIDSAVNLGISMAVRRIKQLAIFSEPTTRRQVIKEIQKGHHNGRWVLRLAQWDQRKDPYGFEILEKCKQLDVEEIRIKANEAKDEIEEIQKYHTQAEAIARGQDLVIKYYKKQIKDIS